MLRRLFTFASALSLLVWLAIGGLWVRSHFALDEVTWHRQTMRGWTSSVQEFHFASSRGEVGVEYTMLRGGSHFITSRPPPPPRTSNDVQWNLGQPLGFATLRGSLGVAQHRFGARHSVVGMEGDDRQEDGAVVVPVWPMFMAAAVLPALWIWRRRGRPEAAGSSAGAESQRESPSAE